MKKSSDPKISVSHGVKILFFPFTNGNGVIGDADHGRLYFKKIGRPQNKRISRVLVIAPGVKNFVFPIYSCKMSNRVADQDRLYLKNPLPG